MKAPCRVCSMGRPATRKKRKSPQLRLKGISGIAVKPTAQDIAIAEGLAAGKKKIEALTDAGISEANARSNSRELTERPGVRAALDAALRKAGVGVDRIAEKINEGLEATKVINATVVNVTDKTGAVKDVRKDFVMVEDFAVRHQYVRTAAELMDMFPDDDIELQNTGSLSVVIKRGSQQKAG